MQVRVEGIAAKCDNSGSKMSDCLTSLASQGWHPDRVGPIHSLQQGCRPGTQGLQHLQYIPGKFLLPVQYHCQSANPCERS